MSETELTEAMGYDGRMIRAGDLVQHCNSGAEVWRVESIRDVDEGRASLSLVDPHRSTRRSALFVDRAVLADEVSG